MTVTASVATRCIPCLVNHASSAASAGVIKAEIVEEAAVGFEFGGDPSFVIVQDQLLDFSDDIKRDE